MLGISKHSGSNELRLHLPAMLRIALQAGQFGVGAVRENGKVAEGLINFS